jgi:predicted permease
MDRYTKAFIVASLAYFVTAAALGIWMGGGGAPEWVWFGHVHFNLLGFMAMMIYGVGYFILPRFNARPLFWPGGVAIHFYLSNIGLVGLVATSPERSSAGFVLFSVLSFLSAILFAVNLGATILIPLKEEGDAVKEASPPAPAVAPDTRMGEIISRWPQTVEVLVKNGFPPLADPAHQEKVKQLPVTLEMACANHGVDLGMMTGLLNEAIARGEGPAAGAVTTASRPIVSSDVIGDILARFPATEGVFRKYYGAACFSCPGQATESIRQSAMMHDADEKELLRELNNAAEGTT